ncbi:MAG: hypothetical protein Q9208_006308 [Pyrenodesmia sp. 3 TL-2023]
MSNEQLGTNLRITDLSKDAFLKGCGHNLHPTDWTEIGRIGFDGLYDIQGCKGLLRMLDAYNLEHKERINDREIVQWDEEYTLDAEVSGLAERVRACLDSLVKMVERVDLQPHAVLEQAGNGLGPLTLEVESSFVPGRRIMFKHDEKERAEWYRLSLLLQVPG